MCSVHFKLLTESALQLIAVVELEYFLRVIDVAKAAEGRMLAWATVLGNAMIAKTKLVAFCWYVDR
ncbi:hypothetical protein WK61_03600 [Burkholderia ubonensis]|nr:hypothetical protein WK61_03600 [Burkholderia ubonensis]